VPEEYTPLGSLMGALTGFLSGELLLEYPQPVVNPTAHSDEFVAPNDFISRLHIDYKHATEYEG
jgi:hypothetical protein